MLAFPFCKASELADVSARADWLVEGLWGEGAVGILGGEPKCCKSFLALDLAVAVASGLPCLGRFQVARPGLVLLFAAEDALSIVRRRLGSIAASRGICLDNLDIQVITAPRIRLDLKEDIAALDSTISELKPRLLILDPFVRLHRIDENSSSEVSAVLEKLRDMQRRHGMAILVVHHSKKGGGSSRAGQALRGSSEFHAWGDSNLYMRRTGDRLVLSAEHRAAAPTSGIDLALIEDGEKLALEIQENQQKKDDEEHLSPEQRIEMALYSSSPMALSRLRETCGIRMSTLCSALKNLVKIGRVKRTDSGYLLAAD